MATSHCHRRLPGLRAVAFDSEEPQRQRYRQGRGLGKRINCILVAGGESPETTFVDAVDVVFDGVIPYE